MKHVKIILFIVCSLVSKYAISQDSATDLTRFINETQINQTKNDNIQIVWWVPVEFWKLSFRTEKNLTEEQKTEFLKVLYPYSLFAVIIAKASPDGNFEYKPVDSIKNKVLLIDNDSSIYKPLELETLDPVFQNLLAAIKPVLKNAIGKLGENTHFFVFNDLNKDGNRISDPLKKGYVRLRVIDELYKWRTPLGVLLPSKTCPKDGEVMNGAWDFCPWHGVPLVIKKTAAR